MKKIVLIFVLLFCSLMIINKPKTIVINEVTYTQYKSTVSIGDYNLRKCIIDNYNYEYGTSLSYSTTLTDSILETITSLTCQGTGEGYPEVDDFNLDLITSVADLSNLTNLEELYITNHNINNLDLRGLSNLESITVQYSNVEDVNISGLTNLKEIDLQANDIKSLNLSTNTNLEELYMSYNELTTLNTSNNTKLNTLLISDNFINSLDVTNNPNLVYLYASSNDLTSIDVSKNTKLGILDISDNSISSINITKNSSLQRLYIGNNLITSLNTSNNPYLYYLYIDNMPSLQNQTKISTLDLSSNTYLKYLYIEFTNLKSIDLSKNTNLEDLIISNTLIETINLTNNTKLKSLYLDNNKLSSLNISTLSSLTYLDINKNNISKITFGSNSALKTMYASNNKLTSFNSSNASNLEYLTLDNNLLTSFTGNSKLQSLYISNNSLKNLNLMSLTNLITLSAANNQLNTVLVPSSLTYLSVENNPFSEDVYILEGSSVNSISLTKMLNETENGYFKISETGKEVNSSLELDGSKINVIGKENGLYKITYNVKNGLYKYNIDTKYNFIITSIDCDDCYKNEDFIYVRDEEDITINNGTYKIIGNYIEVYTLNGDFLAQYDYYKLSFDGLTITNDVVGLVSDLTVEKLNNKLVNKKFTLKVKNNGNEVTSGLIENGMILEVYIDSVKVDTFRFLDYQLSFDELTVLEDKKIVVSGMNSTIQNVIDSIVTDKEYVIKDNSNNIITNYDNKLKSGYTLEFDLEGSKLIYRISVKGDTRGEGNPSISDIMKIVDHVLSDNKMTEDYFLEAADFNDDGSISVSDVMLLVNTLLN